MAIHLRGNLCLKSGPLAPTSSKLSTQHLVIDHMNCHYTKIDKAKSLVDTRLPKSLTTSQKMRDTVSRKHAINSRQLSHVHATGYSNFPNNRIDTRAVHYLMRSTLDKPKGSNSITYESGAYFQQQLPQATSPAEHFPSEYSTSAFRHSTIALPASPDQSLVSSMSCVPIPTHDSLKRTYSGDVLDRRSHLFTQPHRPFSPRTLKSCHQSRLKHSKFYNPPWTVMLREDDLQQERESQRLQTSPHKDKVIVQDKVSFRQKQYTSPHMISFRQDNEETSRPSEDKFMNISVRSHNESLMNYSVPPLAISKDKDHIKWLHEQATKVKVRVSDSSQLKPLQEDHEQPSSGSHSGLGEVIKMELQRRDEENKYLVFAITVTADVVSRGICSDSVLSRVFNKHIERRRYDLDVKRMKSVIIDVCRSIGLQSHVFG